MMVTNCLTSSSSSSSSSSLIFRGRCRIIEPFVISSLPSPIHLRYPKLSLSISLSPVPFFSSTLPINKKNRHITTTVLALVEEEEPLVVASVPEEEGDEIVEEDGSDGAPKNLVKPCELYVCNLPGSCGISELHDMFKPYGVIQAVEVSRDAATGESRGCGYVTMSSMAEAKAAISGLDGSDVGGREMRIRFSADVNVKRKNMEALNSAPKKNLVFESPYKIYVGNLAWSVTPEDLRNLFSQFGTVVSARVLHDRKGGKNRVYGFLSFSTADESKSAMSLSGTDFSDRTLLVREVLAKTQS